MSEVSVIRLGAMGSTLARAFLRDGHRVTVWNRTSTKAEPLVRDGAVLAPSAALAVGASSIVVVCVDNYEVTKTILGSNEVASNLSDRVLVQLSTAARRRRETAKRGWGTKVPSTSMAPSWRFLTRLRRRTP